LRSTLDDEGDEGDETGVDEGVTGTKGLADSNDGVMVAMFELFVLLRIPSKKWITPFRVKKSERMIFAVMPFSVTL
jgi:hypothetical protein